MISSRFRNLGLYAALGAAALGALMLLPGNEDARPTVASIASIEPARPSYLVEVSAVLSTDSFETGSVAATTLAPAEQAMPAALGAPAPIETATLSVTAPMAGSDAFPMESVEPAFDEVAANAQNDTIATAVNMRVGPSTSTSAIMVLPAGEPVAVLGRSKGWVNVALTDGQTGWVFERYVGSAAAEAERLASIEPDRDAAVSRADRSGSRTLEGVILRDRPSRRGAPLFELAAGERVVVAERRGNWVRVRVDGGVSGWLHRRYLD